jgi:methylated-DNA-protein-cysteine methyltransferase-like protein
MDSKKDFFQKVYKVVKMIPSGRVSTYGLIAKYLGSQKSSRVVGYAMNASHQNSDIPAHRVVNRLGLLTGKHHFSGITLMQNLLESEGVKIQNDRVINFKKFLWDPSKELD